MKDSNVNFAREILTWSKIIRFLSLPFRSKGLETLFAVRRFEDIPPGHLLKEGIQGVLVDADGTLGPHHVRRFSDSAVCHVKKLREAGLRVGILTNADENRFQQFQGVIAATNVSPKPNKKGFLEAMEKTLDLNDPSLICMVGDNYVTDGGAVDAGMRFVYVQPIKGQEGVIHRFLKFWGFFWARVHGKVTWLENVL